MSMQDCYGGGGTNYNFEISMGDGVIDVIGAPLTDSAGRVIGAIEYFPEVTAQREQSLIF